MPSFNNSILIVVFNYSSCVNNKDVIQTIYGKHFKKIIFYADTPSTGDSSVNYISINMGFNVHNIFQHFYDNYRSLVEESDGLFYTMDDNIINVNMLDLLRSDKIIYYTGNLNTIDTYKGWWWDNKTYGKNAIYKLLGDAEFQRYGITKFSGDFADWFYLPKKYVTPDLFNLFRLFAKHNVFLELAIPSIIHNTEPDMSQYQTFTGKILWDDDRNKLMNKDYVYTCIKKEHDFNLHPIKFNSNPESKKWLVDMFCKEKCVIITTINKPTETILKHIENPEYDVIIVGDKKTPDNDYKALNCIYLDIESQKKLFPELCDMLPYNHYCRKNLGYLYAIKKGYTVIYETDDDNIPYPSFDSILHAPCTAMITEETSPWINIFKYFTHNAHIWPRGYPLSLLNKEHRHTVSVTDMKASVICGLVKNDPDVDAIFRLTKTRTEQESIIWEENKHVIVNNQNLCVFNTQNTFWINPLLFASMYIPTTVSFRYCDILRGIISNAIMKQTNTYIMYSSPNVIQIRNEHNLIQDFKSEHEMYIANESILDYLESDLSSDKSNSELLKQIYRNLFKHGIIKEGDMRIIELWCSYF